MLKDKTCMSIRQIFLCKLQNHNFSGYMRPVRRDLELMQNIGLERCLVCIARTHMPSVLLWDWWCTNTSLFRALTELLKQPGEAGGVDRGGHHPIGSNGISGRTMRTNNGESELQICFSFGGTCFVYSQGTHRNTERQVKYNECQTFKAGVKNSGICTLFSARKR